MDSLLIDDFHCATRASNGYSWNLTSDRVMGGISRGSLTHEQLHGRPALRLQGEVSLANKGGFVQIALDLASSDSTLDAGNYAGVSLVVRGNGLGYALKLRTSELHRPWQSYRAALPASPDWEMHRLDFAAFKPHRTERALNLRKLRRIGLIAVGAAGSVDLAIAHLSFYGNT